MTSHVLGLDLGQSTDYSALAVLHRVFVWPGHQRGDPFRPEQSQLRHEVPFLMRWRLGTPYPEIVQNVAEAVQRVKEERDCDQVILIVDQSGVGRPVVDMLRRQRVGRMVGVTITGGQSVGEHWQNGEELSVPKRDIASALVMAAQAGLLKVAAELDLAGDFEEELGAFGYQINRQTGRASYESQVSDIHDDLVLAAAIALWYSQTKLPQTWTERSFRSGGATVEDMDYSPLG